MQNPDGNNPDDPTEGGPSEGGRQFDEDAAWASILEHYGDRAQLNEAAEEQADAASAAAEPAEVAEQPYRPAVLEPRWREQLNTEATWDDEGHFVPPNPPPLPPLEPRRKAAWTGLFGAPLMLLIAVVFGFQYPGWLGFLFVASFIGGFGYLVATMPPTRYEDGSGDNGAVV